MNYKFPEFVFKISTYSIDDFEFIRWYFESVHKLTCINACV